MESLTLVPEPFARLALRDRTLVFRLLRPAYAAIGVGMLRVLRLREVDGSVEIVAGYDRYERIGPRP